MTTNSAHDTHLRASVTSNNTRPRLVAGVLAGAVLGTLMLNGGAASAAAGNTYYVATTGQDSSTGSASAPFKTLTKGMQSLKPGDTLVVKGGTYTENVKPKLAKGTANAPITVVAAAGERPVISGLLALTAADYWTLKGINVTWNSANTSTQHMVKMTGGSNWRITGAEIWGAHSYAAVLIAGTPANFRLDHNYIHDTYRSNSNNQDHLIYFNGGTGGGTVERNILARSANGRGLKVGPPSGGTSKIGNLTVRYNTFVDNTGPSNLQLSYGASDNKIYRNVFVRSGAGNSSVTAYNLNGTGNVAYDNIGWQSSAVLDKSGGLVDKGGNVMANPQLGADYRAGGALAAYGRFAPGDTP